MNEEHAGELIELYALGALEPHEQSAVDSHLDECAGCRARMAEARRLVALLAWTPEPREPPPDLRHKVRRRVERLQQTRVLHQPRRFGWQLPWPRWWPALAGAALTLALAVGASNLSLQRRIAALDMEVAAGRQMVEVLSAPEARVIALAPQPAAPAARAKMVLDPDATTGYLVAEGLPELPIDKAYQLWLVAAGERRISGGVFRADDRGSATLLVRADAPMANYIRCGITIEPAAGSPGPTGAAVLRSSAWGSEGW